VAEGGVTCGYADRPSRRCGAIRRKGPWPPRTTPTRGTVVVRRGWSPIPCPGGRATNTRRIC